MRGRLITIIIGLVLILGVDLLVYETKKPVITANNNELGAAQTVSVFTLSQVAVHNSRLSCWSAINNNVYDLTSWIPNHPGGEQNILSLCGTDGSSAYNTQHGGASKPTRILAGFKIGALIK